MVIPTNSPSGSSNLQSSGFKPIDISSTDIKNGSNIMNMNNNWEGRPSLVTRRITPMTEWTVCCVQYHNHLNLDDAILRSSIMKACNSRRFAIFHVHISSSSSCEAFSWMWRVFTYSSVMSFPLEAS